MPDVGLVADVAVIVGFIFGVVKDDVPVTAVVPPPGRFPTAWTVYEVPGVRPVIGQSSGLAHVTVMGEPPPTGVRVTE